MNRVTKRVNMISKHNIGNKGRAKRLVTGIVMFLVSLWLLEFIRINQFPVLSKLVLIIPLYLAFLGIYQSATGVCVMHARRGTCDSSPSFNKSKPTSRFQTVGGSVAIPRKLSHKEKDLQNKSKRRR